MFVIKARPINRENLLNRMQDETQNLTKRIDSLQTKLAHQNIETRAQVQELT